jgi:ribulose-phosphate 3-epimerase
MQELKEMIKVSASILNSDLSALGEQVSRIEKAGADMLHIDVMDGVFVEPITVGNGVVKSIRDKSRIIFDTHLMTRWSERLIPLFAEAGSDIITIHVESDSHISDNLREIRRLGLKAGLSLSPETDVSMAYPYLKEADMFLIMTVVPGYGGQKFIWKTLEKITALREEMKRQGISADIEVDGGINEETAPFAVKAGANILVAGTYLFNSPNMAGAIEFLKNL